MSLVFFAIFALILLCPVAVNAADEDKKSEFGTVIGIGERLPLRIRCPFAYVALQILAQRILALGELKCCDVSCENG